MIIDQPRSRASSRLARRYFTDVTTPFMDRGAHCMRAALANAIHALGIKEFAEEFWDKEKRRCQKCSDENGYYPRLFSFGCYSSLLLNIYPRTFGLSKIKPPEDVPSRRVSRSRVCPWANVSPSYLMRLADNPETSKVYILSVVDSSGAKHAICLDARYSPPLIFDCAERKVMEFRRPEVLSICCPSPKKNEYDYFDDLRVVQDVWKETKSRARPGTDEHAQGASKKLRGSSRRARKLASQAGPSNA